MRWVDLAIDSVALPWVVGSYGGQAAVALVALRHLPRMVELDFGGQKFVGVVPRRFIWRVRIYGWAGVLAVSYFIARLIIAVVALF